MGYEVYALLVPPGEASEESLATVIDHDQVLEGATPLDPAKEARKRSIAAALAQSSHGYAIVEHDFAEAAEEQDATEEEMRRRLRHVQCENGAVAVAVDEEHAHVLVPYAGSLDPAEVAETMFETLRILRDEAKLVPYDPQLRRELDLDSDADRMALAEAFARGVEQARRDGREEPLTERQRRPWWKRLVGGG